MDIANRIKLIRGTLTQQDFAERLGIHKNSLGRYERGDSVPDVGVAQKICLIFGISPAWFLFGTGAMKEDGPSATVSTLACTAPCSMCAMLHEKLEMAHERLFQAGERERELLKDNCTLRERIVLFGKKTDTS